MALKLGIVLVLCFGFSTVSSQSKFECHVVEHNPCIMLYLDANFNATTADSQESSLFNLKDAQVLDCHCPLFGDRRMVLHLSTNETIEFTFHPRGVNDVYIKTVFNLQPDKHFQHGKHGTVTMTSDTTMDIGAALSSYLCLSTELVGFKYNAPYHLTMAMSNLHVQAYGIIDGQFSPKHECKSDFTSSTTRTSPTPSTSLPSSSTHTMSTHTPSTVSPTTSHTMSTLTPSTVSPTTSHTMSTHTPSTVSPTTSHTMSTHTPSTVSPTTSHTMSTHTPSTVSPTISHTMSTPSTVSPTTSHTMSTHTPSTVSPTTSHTMSTHTPSTVSPTTSHTMSTHTPSTVSPTTSYTMSTHTPSTVSPKTSHTMSTHTPSTSMSMSTMSPTPITIVPKYGLKDPDGQYFCIVLQGEIEFEIPYTENDGKTSTSAVRLPRNATVTGSCSVNGTNSTQQLTLSFFNDWTFTVTLGTLTVKDDSKDGLTGNKVVYSWNEITLDYVIDDHFFQPKEKGKHVHVLNQPTFDTFKSDNNGSFKCVSREALKMDNVTIDLSELQYRGFGQTDSEDFPNTDVTECAADKAQTTMKPTTKAPQHSHAGSIVGGVVGGIAVVVIIVGAVIYYRKRQATEQNYDEL